MRKVQPFNQMFSLNVYQFVSGTLPDERYGAKPPPLEVFNFDILTTKYVKFTMISKEISTIKFALREAFKKRLKKVFKFKLGGGGGG